MNIELQKYYENRFQMFSETGWNDLLTDINQIKEVVENLRNCRSNDDLQYKKGQLDIIDWLITLQQVSEKAYTELLNEDDNAPV
ncbi:MAG: hypothetical protein RBT52_06330 [Sulfurimonas sp.]|jgi:hypothetical protein|nr:hypothetical protein [Sulfurimonas sp.]